jgi:hypothetical protein
LERYVKKFMAKVNRKLKGSSTVRHEGEREEREIIKNTN